MRYHLFHKVFGKMVKIKETSFLSTREDTNFLPPLYKRVYLFLASCIDKRKFLEVFFEKLNRISKKIISCIILPTSISSS